MKLVGLAGAFFALLFSVAVAQVGLPFPGPGTPASSGGGTNHLAFDASTTVASTAGASESVTLTTTQTNDTVVLCIQNNATPVASITDTAGLTWTQIGTRVSTISVFFAQAPSILSSDVITVNFTSGGAFDAVQAAAFSGANIATPLDSNGALPGSTSTSGVPLTLTTSNAFDLLFACYALNGGETAGSGWTFVPNAGSTGFDAFEYQIVNTTQSATPANLSSNTQIKAGIGAALVSR
jgi:hypothetical protein